jgi:O-antigen/teichoic acid export membrane protein
MATGAVWMVLFKLAERSLGLISTLILARLLMPSDFGTVAMAMSFVLMAELLTAFSFDVAIIQNAQATEHHYSSAWTGNLILGASIAALMVAAAVPVAEFYQHPELVAVICALAAGPLLTGLENIGIVAFRKELDFRREFIFQVSRKLIAFCVVVPLAFLLRNYWALVIGTLVSKAAASALSYWMHPFRPRLTCSRLGSLFKFSRWLLVNNVVSFLKERSSDFFIGRMHGAQALGTYNIAYEFAHLPTTELGAPINRALLPGFAKMEQAEQVQQAYASAVSLLALLALPAAGILFALAPVLVPVILGAKWMATIPLMQVLAFNGALLLFHGSICAVLMGRGYPGRVTLVNAVFVAVFIALLGPASALYGLMGAACAALTTSLVCTPLYLLQLKRTLDIAPAVFGRAIGRPLFATVVTVVLLRAVLPADSAHLDALSSALWLLAGAALGVVTYAAAVLALWQLGGRRQGAEQIVVAKLGSLFGQWSRTRA